MRKAFKHTGALMMAAIIGLSVVGAAYALWFEDLRMVADANTGTFDVDWSIEADAEAIVSPDLGERWATESSGRFPAEKFPDCGIALGETDLRTAPNFPSSNDEVSNNRLDLQLDNLYPYAGCEFVIDIHNVGTVPAHIQVLTPPNAELCQAAAPAIPGLPEPNECAAANPLIIEIDPNGSAWEGTAPADCVDGPNDTNGAGCPSTLNAAQACRALFEGPEGSTVEGLQLHTSNELHCTIRVYLDQVDEAEGDNYFVFVADLRAHQWNEDQGN